MHSAASGRIRFDELRCTLCVPLSVDIKVNLIMPGSTLRNSVRYQIAAGVMSDAAADGSAPDRLIVSREHPGCDRANPTRLSFGSLAVRFRLSDRRFSIPGTSFPHRENRGANRKSEPFMPAGRPPLRTDRQIQSTEEP